MIKILNKSDCCGCSACANICPKRAIEMMADEEGFLYPNIDLKECVKCGLCEDACPIKNPKPFKTEVRKTYEIQCKDDDALKRSASGGFMNLIAQYVLNRGGCVCGAAYCENNEVRHVIIDSFADVYKLSGSKYVQSQIGDSYKIIERYLKNGMLVCFSGTPCQVAGLQTYLKKDYKNLILVEVLCAGVPSPELWKKYLIYQEDKYNSKIDSVNFRNKTYGYQCSTMMLLFENGDVYSQSGRTDPMMKLFVSGIAKRPSCYHCQFKGDNRVSDYTIFDGWSAGKLAGIKDNDKGYTAVVVHTKKAEKVFNSLKEMNCFCVNYEETKIADGIMFDKQPTMHPDRGEFYKYLSKYGIEKAIEKYMPIKKVDKVKEYMKPVLYKLGIIKVAKRVRQIIE